MPDIYTTPQSNLVQPATGDEQWGSLEKGINGDYSFAIGDVIKEAWAVTSGSKRIILGGLIVSMLVTIPLSAVLSAFAPVQAAGWIALIGYQLVTSIISGALVLPLYGGIMMFAVKRAAGQTSTFGDLFSYYPKFIPLLILNVLVTITIYVGYALLILPGIYLTIAYSLAFPLMLEKNLSPWQAMETSRKAITHKWFQVFGLFIVVFLLMMLAMIPLGIGLIWVAPMLFLVYGILYRTIFGFDGIQTHPESPNTGH